LQSGQTGDVEEVALVVDEEVSHLVRFFMLVLPEEYADAVVKAVHEQILNL
jgi:hypothetical protein